VTRNYLVTGASSGIGEAVARALHERGDHVVLTARHEERAAQLRDAFPGSTVLVADLDDPGEPDVTGLPEALDGVVHAAGVIDVGTVADTAADSLRRTLTVNLLAPVQWTRVLLEPVRRARGTHVFVNSGSGLRANPEWAAYNASKFGLRGFADALRAEEAEHGVRVTSVYPGRTATRMQEEVHAQEGKEYDASAWIQPQTVVDAVLGALDLGEDATIPDVVIRPR
jgi:short-subunit dehydrogenase